MATKNNSTKQCKTCKKILSVDDFHFSDKLRDSTWRRGDCKACLLSKHQEHRRNIKSVNIEIDIYQIVDINEKKYCYKCNLELYISDFYRDISSIDGFSNECKSCSKERSKDWRENHKDYVLEKVNEWVKNNPEKSKLAKKKYTENNPEKVRQSQRDFYQNHIEEERKRSIEKRHRQRAHEKELQSDWRTEYASFAFQYWHYACAICETENGMWHVIALDHWIPIASDRCPGTISTNIVPLCHAIKDAPPRTPCCNQSKGAKDPMLWLTEKLGSRKAKAKLKEIEAFFIAAKAFAEAQQSAAD